MPEQYTPPDIHVWKFASELSEYALPVFPNQPGDGQLILVQKNFPDKSGVLKTAYESLVRYFTAAGYRFTSDEGKADLRIAVTVNPGFSQEQYGISIHRSQVKIEAAGQEGIRRGIYALTDVLCENSGRLPEELRITREPWLKTRLGRSPFSPIKRWPVYTDELLDDQDYYPDALLERLAHDAVNGIWIVSELRELSETSFRKTDSRREQRLKKLEQLVQKCHGYGIKVYLFMIEPFAVLPDDELLRDHPEMFGPPAWGGKTCFCPAEANTRQYLFDSFRSIFTAAPQLGGVINICLGERPTTCLSSVRTSEQRPVACQTKCGLGMDEIMERNLRVISQETLACRNWDEIGYEKTLELLRAPLRPDALIVYPDNAVTGAIQAILQLGICVPEELSVVFHRNVELPYFCPFAARFLDTRLSDIVDKLIESISVQEIQRKETVS